MAATAPAHREIPVVPGPPLLGHLAALTTDPAALFARCYRTHGPVFRVRAPGRMLTVLTGPDLARFMGSREGQRVLSVRPVYQGLLDEFGASDSIGAADGAHHRKLREIMRRGYSREALDGRLPEFLAITDRQLDADWTPGRSVRVVDALQRLSVSQLGILLTGQAPLEHVDDIRHFIGTILNVLVVRQRPRLLLRSPGYRRAKARTLALAEQLVIDLRDRPERDPAERTLVDDILAAHRRDPELVPERDLTVSLTGPYVAGLDTVAQTLGGLLYLVLKHPDVLARIRAEAAEVFAGPMPEDVVGALPTAHGAVLETMRLYPIAVAQPRVATEDFVFAGHRIRAGEQVLCSTTTSHFLEEFFPAPERFDVDRFGPGRREHAVPGAYAPFGKGPHTCLGKGIAEIQMTLTAARIVHRLDLALPRPDAVLRRRAAPTPGPVPSFAVRVLARRDG